MPRSGSPPTGATRQPGRLHRGGKSSSKTTTFRFDYTFTSDDAVAGKVTFKAIAVIDGAADALPQDNEMIAPATTVKAK